MRIIKNVIDKLEEKVEATRKASCNPKYKDHLRKEGPRLRMAAGGVSAAAKIVAHYFLPKKGECRTPGCNYVTEIHEKNVSIKVKLPKKLNLTKAKAIQLESDLHDYMEQALVDVGVS